MSGRTMMRDTGLSKEALMNLTELFSGELDREAKITRRALERVPEGRD
jgi:hypothetical protein